MILLVALVAQADDFNYGQQGADWSETYPQCSMGHQSPVALDQSSALRTTDTVILQYPSLGGPGILYNTGKGLAMTLPDAYRAGFALSNDSSLDGASIYRLKQIRFHAPAEHHLDQNVYPLELQLTHYNIITHQLATVCVVFDGNGESSAFLSHFSDTVPTESSETSNINTRASGIYGNLQNNDVENDLSFSSIMQDTSYFVYNGSITEPPCVPSLVLVRNGPVGASSEQVHKLVSAIKSGCATCTMQNGNARIVQSLSSSLNLVESMNWGDKRKQVTKTAVAMKPILAARLFCPKDMNKSDTKDVVKAKAKCHIACSSASNARNWKAQASLKLTKAQNLYKAARGIVNKIDLKWGVVAAEGEIASAIVAMGKADALCQASLVVVGELVPEEVGAEKRKQVEEVKFVPRGNLPAGEDADPFRTTVAETTARVYAGGTLVTEKVVSDLSRPEPNVLLTTSFLQK